jgi:hypothetical protein
MEEKMKNTNYKWPLIVTILSFILSIIMSLIANLVLKDVSLLISIIITFIFILLGIVFDIIGVAVTVGDITVFNSMASRKVRGGKVGVYLIKKKSNVSSICCDVVGDICGIISGVAGVSIIAIISKISNYNPLLVSLIVTALISSLTIGGKALGKNFGLTKSDKIITFVSKILSIFTKK